VQRGKLESNQEEYIMLNQYPTYDSIFQAYVDLYGADANLSLLSHKKEQMLYMIITLLRVRPQIFGSQLH